MAFIPAISVLKVELLQGMNGQLADNVFHVYNSAGVWDSTNMAAYGAIFVSWWNTNIKPLYTSTGQLNFVRLTDLTTATALAIDYTTGTPISGTHTTGTVLPNNVALVVSWLTPSRGRSYRGRTYHGGMHSDQQTGNQATSGFRTSLQAAYNALLTAVNVTTYSLRVVSFFSGGAARAEAVTTPITSGVVNLDIDSMRRRLAGRGR
jgi:hypothetical protein